MVDKPHLCACTIIHNSYRKIKMAGIDCQFVMRPPKAFQCECPICLLVLREPYQATCCGKSFCKECIKETIKTQRNKTCPMCMTENFFMYPNKGLQLSLYELEVYCTHRSKGCEWTGELRELNYHLNSDPPADRSLEGCPFVEVQCPVSSAGCEAKQTRREIKRHIQEELVWHTQTQAREILRLRRRYETLYFTFNNFKEHMTRNLYWYSPPFYAPPRPCGYKMYIGISAYGKEEAFGTHVSVYVHLANGDFDQYIKWPFVGSIVIKIAAQKGEEPCTKTITYSEDTPRRYSEVKPYVDLNDGWGCSKFLPHVNLESRYLHDDTLHICVAKVTMREDYMHT